METRKTAHTQEPWYAETVYMADNTPYEAIRANVNGAPYTIAVLDCFDGAAPEAEVLANRDLMVAAPALLAALEALEAEATSALVMLPKQDTQGKRLYQAAIVKARAALALASSPQA